MTTGLREQLQEMIGATYSIGSELGGGGMSRVFVAEERALGRPVVVKVLPAELSSAVSAERFRREVQVVARLQHPGLVPLLSTGSASDGELLYYTMPLVEGESLRARLAREGELPIGDVVRILREIADALSYAHAHDVVHRDIKPANVLLTGSHALVTDFGIAKALGAAAAEGSLTGTGLALGTPAYMSPEQVAADRHVDHRADIYALGALAYEMLTGSPPFVRATTQATLSAHVTQAPQAIEAHRPNVPPVLAALVMRCLEKHPADRPQSAAEVLQELEAPADHSVGGGLGFDADRLGRHRRYLLAVAAGLALATAGYSVFGDRIDRGVERAAAIRQSVAVLPFENLSGSDEDEYFSDGMTEELIMALAQVPGLQVINRSSSFAFKGTTVDVRDVARRLEVGSVLTGSSRRIGDRLRVSVQLADGHSGRSLWSQSYQRDAKDVFAVQDEIARAIVATLKLTMEENGSLAPGRSGTTDLEAYDLFLLGRHVHNQGEDGLLRALGLFERAIERDSGYARAYAMLAHVYSDLGSWYGVPPLEATQKADSLIARALEIDETLPAARRELGVLRAREYRWAEAESEFRRAIAADPSDADTHVTYALFLAGRRRPQEAVEVIGRAQRLDPLADYASWQKGRVLYAARRYDESIREYDRAIALNVRGRAPRFLLGQTYIMKGMYETALVHLDTARALGAGPAATWRSAYALARMGRLQESRALLDELLRLPQSRSISPGDIALVYTSLGETDQAFVWLERAYEERDWWIGWLAVEPLFDPIRDDPRFERLLLRAGMKP